MDQRRDIGCPDRPHLDDVFSRPARGTASIMRRQATMNSLVSLRVAQLTFERQSRIGYLIVIKCVAEHAQCSLAQCSPDVLVTCGVARVGQILMCIALTAYPTFLRNFGGIGLGVVNLTEIACANCCGFADACCFHRYLLLLASAATAATACGCWQLLMLRCQWRKLRQRVLST